MNTVCLQADGLVSYGNDALMPDQAYSSVPMDTGLDGLGFVHPESFNQANTENHGRTRSHRDVTLAAAALGQVRSGQVTVMFFSPQLSLLMLVQSPTEGCPPDLVRVKVELDINITF